MRISGQSIKADAGKQKRYIEMRVSIRKVLNKEDEKAIIECVEITSEIRDICSYIQNKGMELSGLAEGQLLKKFRLEDVYYFEALDEKVFAYTGEQVYEVTFLSRGTVNGVTSKLF